METVDREEATAPVRTVRGLVVRPLTVLERPDGTVDVEELDAEGLEPAQQPVEGGEVLDRSRQHRLDPFAGGLEVEVTELGQERATKAPADPELVDGPHGDTLDATTPPVVTLRGWCRCYRMRPSRRPWSTAAERESTPILR